MLLHIKPILDKKWMYATELAQGVGISRQTLSKYIHGKVFPKEDMIRKIANVLEVPVWRLFVDPNESIPVINDKSVASCPHCGRELKLNIQVRKPQ